jgi:hypothetical protein
LALSKGPKRAGVSLPSPEDGNTSSLRNVVFSSYLEFQTMDKVHKPSDSEEIHLFDCVLHILEMEGQIVAVRPTEPKERATIKSTAAATVIMMMMTLKI